MNLKQAPESAEADESLLDAMVDAYSAMQSSKDRGRSQQEIGMQAALQVYLNHTEHVLRLAEEASPAPTMDAQLLAAADKQRLRFAQIYEENLKGGVSPMSGNVDFARLEGAVHVVQAIRSAIARAESAQAPAPQPVAVSAELTDAQIDRILSTRIPGGSAARDWFLPHELPKGLANVRDVVRAMLKTANQSGPLTDIHGTVAGGEVGKGCQGCAGHTNAGSVTLYCPYCSGKITEKARDEK